MCCPARYVNFFLGHKDKSSDVEFRLGVIFRDVLSSHQKLPFVPANVFIIPNPLWFHSTLFFGEIHRTLTLFCLLPTNVSPICWRRTTMVLTTTLLNLRKEPARDWYVQLLTSGVLIILIHAYVPTRILASDFRVMFLQSGAHSCRTRHKHQCSCLNWSKAYLILFMFLSYVHFPVISWVRPVLTPFSYWYQLAH